MKLMLCLFEQLSGRKINFHKSELFYYGRDKEEQGAYRQLFGCELGSCPLVISVYQFIIANFLIKNGNASKIELKKN